MLDTAWDDRDDDRYAESHRYLMDELIPDFRAVMVGSAAADNSGGSSDGERTKAVIRELTAQLGSMMTIRSSTDKFFGEDTVSLSPLVTESESTDAVVVCKSPRAAKPDFEVRLNAQKRLAATPTAATTGSKKGRQLALSELNKLSTNSDFLWRLLLGNFPGIIDLPPGVQQDIRFFSATGAGESGNGSGGRLDNRHNRAQHDFGRHIDTICGGSGKVARLQQFLQSALVDKELPMYGGCLRT